MSRDRAVLVVGASAETLEALRAPPARVPRTRLLQASTPRQALDLAREHAPFLVLLEGGAEGSAMLELAAALRVAFGPLGAALAVVGVTPEIAAAARSAELDHVLERPLASDALLEILAAAWRAAELRERLEAACADVARLEERSVQNEREIVAWREKVERLADQASDLLVAMLELGVAGALDRGARIADMAARLAARFDVPANLLPDLTRAARLHELGRLVTVTDTRKGIGAGPNDAWRYAQATVAILRHAEGLSGAADLIGGLYENWDGTGHPGHWQAGQIPLRCRILRVLVDYFAAVESHAANPAALLESFEEHAGTLYDPVVLVHLKALLEGAGDEQVLGSKVMVPITELRVGMILAEDLYTEAGLKLLARDTELTLATLEVIQRRHRAEPILQGAAIRRNAA